MNRSSRQFAADALTNAPNVRIVGVVGVGVQKIDVAVRIIIGIGVARP